MRVRILTRLLLFIIMQIAFLGSYAQKKSDAQKVTPQTARQKEADALEKKQNEYNSRKDHHLEVQDKATRKRMKKNLRKARRLSWGKNIPWYKRWFRRN